MFVDFNILNQLGSPSINSNTFANRPAAGQTGRLFVSTDTFEIYRDNGTTWDLIGGPGSSTITGTGTATQVAYFTSSQAIGSSANLFWDNTNTRLGINTATPGAALDIHSTGIMAQLNSTSATANSLLAFQRSGSGLWRIGDVYNGGPNYFELYNTVLGINAMQVFAATNKTSWQATENYTSGVARGNYFDYNLTLNPANPLASPNAISAVGASLDLTLEGSITIPSGARSGLDAYNSIRFTTTGTLTHNQGTQIRAYSNLTAGWAFNGTATGTITHLAGLRALFPDNTGSAVTVTNNYALLLNDQTANTGTVTYTNRWGVYQEGASDLNYMAANLLLGSTVNSGEKLQVTGAGKFTSTLTAGLITADNADIYAQNGTGTNLSIGFKQSSAVKFRLRYDIAGDTVSMVGSSGNFIQTWLQTGDTGIGTNAPAAKLDVLGSSSDQLRLRTAASEYYGIGRNGSTGYLDFYGSQTGYVGYVWGGIDGERMRLDAGGRLGINSNSPDNLFTVQKDMNTSTAIPDNGVAGLVVRGSTSIFKRIGIGYDTTNNRGVIQAQITGTGPSPLLLNPDGGNLGIGTSTPSNNFVVSNGGAAGFELGVASVSASGGTLIENYNRSTGLYVQQRTISLDYLFDTNAGTAINIKTNGNTLIGTTTDAGFKLDVNGTIRMSATGNPRMVLKDSDSGSGNVGILFVEGSTNTWSFASVAGNIQFFSEVNSANRFNIKATGQARFVPLAADPAGAEAGDVYYNSGTNKLRLYDGSNWVDLN